MTNETFSASSYPASREEARAFLKQRLLDMGHDLSESEVDDFGVQGSETEKQLDEWARDYASDIATDDAEYRHMQKHGGYYDDHGE